MVLPTKPGYYWYKEHAEGWKIVEVDVKQSFWTGTKYEVEYGVNLFVLEDTLSITSFKGEWGPKIDPPKDKE